MAANKKSSVINMLIENLKRRLWPFALTLAGLFFSLPIYSLLLTSEWKERLMLGITTLGDVQTEFYKSILSPANVFLVLVIIVLAYINSLNGFSYLQDKNRCDMYCSLPIKRTTLFVENYATGIVMFALPFIVMWLITIIFGFSGGFMTGKILACAIPSLIYFLLIYILNYSFGILAVLLTGNIMVSILASLVFAFYFPMFFYGIESLMSSFFVTCYENPDSFINKWLEFLSPVFIPFKGVSILFESESVTFPGEYVVNMVICAVVSVLLFVLGHYLIRVRKTEVCSHAMAFNATKPVIKVCAMILAGIYGSLLMFYISGKKVGWLLFGLAIALMLAHAICEIIYEFDFKACIKHLFSFATGAVLTVLIIGSFVFDVFSYDKYIPDINKVSYAAISSAELQGSENYILMKDKDRQVLLDGGELDFTKVSYIYGNIFDYRLSHMEVDNAEAFQVLAASGLDWVDRNRYKMIFDNYYDPYAVEAMNPDEASERANITEIIIKWHLNNGRNVYRSYYIDITEGKEFEAFEDIYGTEEYKKGVYRILGADEKEIGNIDLSTPFYNKKLDLSDSEKQRLLKAVCTDINDGNARMLKEEYPIARLNCLPPGNGSMYAESSYSAVIYPSYKNTVSVLRDNGYEIDNNILTDDPSSIVIGQYNEEGDNYDEKEYFNREDIEKIIAASDPSEYLYENYALYKKAYSDINVDVYYEITDRNAGRNSYVNFRMRSDEIPDFLRNDLGLE
ncbi:MAG: ABC transporter permease [Lachnospiraceae bacterium]|nr:ABC transporter permease [Lachnospiraceae bacterium]